MDIETPNEIAAESADADEQPAEPTIPMDWFAVCTFSGYEARAQTLLEERIRNLGLAESFGEVLVPTEEIVEIRGGVRRTRKRKLMPGYIFVQMAMGTEAWHCVKDTQKIIGFVGDDKNPKPMSKREVATLTQQVEETATRPKAQLSFEQGTQVRVVDGPFLNFSGTVEEVMHQKKKVRVLVSIFGRATPVELDFMQVERM
jgi:transcriptional antiterminator NusG